MGRKRKHNPKIPRHIDQSALPAGIYWSNRGTGHWYVVEIGDKGRPTTRHIAGPNTPLSELHRIVEMRAGVDTTSLRWLCTQYEESPNFKKKAPSTQDSYKKSRQVVLSFPTKTGGTVGDLPARVLNRAFVQRLVDKIAAGHRHDAAGQLIPTPTKAVHALSYLSVVLRWGANRGHVDSNVAEGVEAPEQVRRNNMPKNAAFEAIIQYARTNAHDGRGGVRGRPGTCPSYLWPVAVLAYRCRLRGIEVITLTDANALQEGVRSNRRKGSRDNVTAWTTEMREAWAALLARRNKIWKARSFPIPMDPARRPLVVTTTGDPLSKSGFDSAWQRMISGALRDGAITSDQRFSLHGLKHKGITDTDGTRADKQEASGHRAERLMDTYDHSVPVVLAAGEKRHKTTALTNVDQSVNGAILIEKSDPST
jgi:hypothetical protein